MQKARLSDTIRPRKVDAVTIRYFVLWHKPVSSLTCCIALAMSTTPMEPMSLCFCVLKIYALSLNGTIFESRMDSAFFSKKVMSVFDYSNVKFTASVPFERLTELKGKIEQRKRWRRIDKEWSYFETNWKPKSWDTNYRFIFTRRKTRKQHKGPIQLDLFEPRDFNYDYKVIVTNKGEAAKAVILFHNGRGSQEAIFGDAKGNCGLNVIPTRRLAGNQVYTLCSMMAHNLSRKEIQMISAPVALSRAAQTPCSMEIQNFGHSQASDCSTRRTSHTAARRTHPNHECKQCCPQRSFTFSRRSPKGCLTKNILKN